MRTAKMECCRSQMSPDFLLAVKVNSVMRNETKVSTNEMKEGQWMIFPISWRDGWGEGEGGFRSNHHKERYYSKHFASSTMPCIFAYAFYKVFIFIKHGLVSRWFRTVFSSSRQVYNIAKMVVGAVKYLGTLKAEKWHKLLTEEELRTFVWCSKQKYLDLSDHLHFLRENMLQE